MYNSETLLNDIKNTNDLKGKKELILTYIKNLRCSTAKKQKLSQEMQATSSLEKLDRFAYNLYLIGEGMGTK